MNTGERRLEGAALFTVSMNLVEHNSAGCMADAFGMAMKFGCQEFRICHRDASRIHHDVAFVHAGLVLKVCVGGNRNLHGEGHESAPFQPIPFCKITCNATPS